jgi:hypothetical protein
MQCKTLSKGSTPAIPIKRVIATSSAFALTLIAGACGGQDSKVTLPSTTPPAGPTTASPSSSASLTTPQTAVVAAYTSFFPAVNQALQATPERSRSILQGYAAGDYLDFEIRQVMDHQARHLEPWGKTVVHVTKLELNRDVAKVHDCQDASNAGLADARTHQVIPQSRGNAHRNLIAEMKLGSDGRWRLTDLKQYRAVCHPS